jgi:hypothetical protein
LKGGNWIANGFAFCGSKSVRVREYGRVLIVVEGNKSVFSLYLLTNETGMENNLSLLLPVEFLFMDRALV